MVQFGKLVLRPFEFFVLDLQFRLVNSQFVDQIKNVGWGFSAKIRLFFNQFIGLLAEFFKFVGWVSIAGHIPAFQGFFKN